MHLLGVLAHQAGKNDAAMELISKAVTIKSDHAEAHYNLGNVFQKLARLDDAVTSYETALTIKPDYVDAHYNLGNVLTQLGQFEKSVPCFHKSLEIRPDHVMAWNNLANVFQELGRLDEAVTSYNKILAIKPNYAEIHYNLGNVHQKLGRLDEAVTNYQQALDIKPDYAVAWCGIANVYQKSGKPDEAEAGYHRALALDSQYAEAHNHLGLLLQDCGRLDEAVTSYQNALAINPDYAGAHSNMGSVYQNLGIAERAFACHRRAAKLNPHNNLFWIEMAQSLETLTFAVVDDDLRQDLLSLIERPTVRPSRLVGAIVSALYCDETFLHILETTIAQTTVTCDACRDAVAQLSAIPLFLRIMQQTPLKDLKIERMLSVLRRAMLDQTDAGTTDRNTLPFAAALSLQCFMNEYIFPETDAEDLAVDRLQQKIADIVDRDQDVSPYLIAMLGTYRPLHQFPWAQKLADGQSDSTIKDVIERQLSEPLLERSLRAQFTCLTPVQDSISQVVREQYEENPYPRWITTGLLNKGRSIASVFQEAPLHFDLGDYISPKQPEILIAGCGTGQHSINTAVRFENAQVLAVDLSLSSLSYAKRKTMELGLSNIEYAQADIMELHTLERQFDLIESSGVLHHLHDPLAGWKILTGLLRPNGLMGIGLYSETARQYLIDGRALIAKKGYSASATDIRQCRQDIIAMAEHGQASMIEICKRPSFFNASDFRDLLIHVQEHRFTLPQIQAALESMQLEFLGFDFGEQSTVRKFQATYPDKDALTSLSMWHEFELKNPNTFVGMYQFWCKKM